MIKSIVYYMKKGVETPKIRMYLNKVYDTDLTTAEVSEAIKHITQSKRRQHGKTA